MAKSTITVALDLSDAVREEEIAVVLAEERGIVAGHSGDFEPAEQIDVVVTDGDPIDGTTPHVLIADSGATNGEFPVNPAAISGANVMATMPEAASPEMVAAAIRLVAEGYRVVAPPRALGPDGETRGERFHLSAREHEVLALLSEGAPNKVIARRLDISVHTAKFHVAAIVSKLHATNRTDAIAIAMREGLMLL